MSLAQAVCSFCGKSLPMAESVSVTIQPRIDSEKSQHLVAHSSCLRAQIIKDIVLITELTD